MRLNKIPEFFPHIVQFGDGNYGVRRRCLALLGGFAFLDMADGRRWHQPSSDNAPYSTPTLAQVKQVLDSRRRPLVDLGAPIVA